jgi:hypothetical protein
VSDRDVSNLLALDVSMDGMIAPFMYFMLAIGVDLVAEQLMRRVMLVRCKRLPSEGQDTDRGNSGAEKTASAIHGILLVLAPVPTVGITVAELRRAYHVTATVESIGDGRTD